MYGQNISANFIHDGCACAPVYLSGIVISMGAPAGGIVIDYSINGVHYTTTTDVDGRYTVRAPRGAHVTIHAVAPGVGVAVEPPLHTICRACADQDGLGFVLVPLGPPMVTVRGHIQGLRKLCNEPVVCWIDGVERTFMTDMYGNYCFTVPYGASLKVHPVEHCGYALYPSDLYYDHVYRSITLPTCSYVPMCV